MTQEDKHSDCAFALELCQKLKAGRRQAITAVHSRCHGRFVCFVRQKLYAFPQSKTDRVVNTFWLELMDGKMICAYQGKGPLSLCAFLMVRLNWRIKDEIRRTSKEKQKRVVLSGPNESEGDAEERMTSAAVDAGELEPLSVETAMIGKERRQIVHAVLMQLQDIAPDDAQLIRGRFLKGLTYREIAEAEMGDENPDADVLAKKARAVKKQFTRPRTGSMAKFKIILTRYLRSCGIEPNDLMV